MFSQRTVVAKVRPYRGILRASLQRSRCLHSQSTPGISNEFLKISDEVQEAVSTGRPVVALESTIYTHGFPHPENVALASRLEKIVRSAGGVPATIGVLNGVARVGLSASELAELASSSVQGKELIKVSRRDLGFICGTGLVGRRINGGTTIAGTMVLAHLAGIKVFATGGLGGVHRGGENSMDISADLTELGRTPVALISSGCKSFLDIPRTLEYLETEGVLAGAFADGRKGRVDFPAFFSRESGLVAPKVIQDEAQAAAIIYAQSKLPVVSGSLFANPIPEKYSIAKDEMDGLMAKAVELAELEGIHGSDNTPFVLSKIRELSGGRSVQANTSLVESNVERGTRVAVELSKLESGRRKDGDGTLHGAGTLFQASPTANADRRDFTPTTEDSMPASKSEVAEMADILVAGALAVDLACDYKPSTDQDTSSPALRTSNPSTISQSVGGVGLNIAMTANYLGTKVLFCSVVADDLAGRAALDTVSQAKLHLRGVQKLDPVSTGTRTAQYIAVNDHNKELLIAMADMNILELPTDHLNYDGVWEHLARSSQPTWAVIDANWSPSTISRWITLCKSQGMKVALEPVSAPKSKRLFSRGAPVISSSGIAPNHVIDLVTPNQYELASMHQSAQEAELFETPEWWTVIDSLKMRSGGSREHLISLTSPKMVDDGIPQRSIQLLPFMPCIITKLGSQGALLTQLLPPGDSRLSSAEYAPYILGRSTSNDSTVGGLYMRLFPPAEILSDADVVSVNGAGDTLVGTVVSALARRTKEGVQGRVEDIIPIAQEASIKTLKSQGGISPEIGSLSSLFNSAKTEPES